MFRDFEAELDLVFSAAGQDFIACFTSESDQLSQWRGYAGDGSGLAIGFDLEEMGDFCGKFGCCGPTDVIYDDLEQAERIGNILKCYSKGNENGALMKVLRDSVVLLKDRAFSEEKEWRVFYRPELLPCLETKFRTSRFGIAPYVALSFLPDHVKEIVCGPKCTMRGQHSVLRQFLTSVGFSEGIEIRNSLASYR